MCQVALNHSCYKKIDYVHIIIIIIIIIVIIIVPKICKVT